MSLALCHKIPRDVFLLVALFFVLVSIVLQCVVVAHHSSKSLVGHFTLLSGEANDETVAYLSAYPVIYTSKLDNVTVCASSDSLLQYDCARFVESYHIIIGLIISSLVSSIIMFLAGMLFTTFLGHTTSGLLRRLTTMICIPTVLHCATISIFYTQTVPHALKTLKLYLEPKTSHDLFFHRGSLVNLTIAAFCMLGVAFIIVFVRWIFALVTRWRFIHSVSHRREKARKLMALHIINDDWERQQQILRSHAGSINVGLQSMDGPIRHSDYPNIGLRPTSLNDNTSSSVDLSAM